MIINRHRHRLINLK